MALTSFKFAQSFGDKQPIGEVTEADIISTVEFDHTGDYLATGDKGGRVVVFERSNEKVAPSTSSKRKSDKYVSAEYGFYAEFQSHEPEFDYLKSLEIEEKINKIKWCKRSNAAHFLLSTNDKTIKLWKIYDKKVQEVTSTNLDGRRDASLSTSIATLKVPQLVTTDTVVAATPRRIYANAHAYHINSISLNSDGETYLSADDLRINLWNLDISSQSFNIVDIKPENMEELTEVITSSEFHPISCNIFLYSSSKGNIKLADMRQAALCDVHAKNFEEAEDPSKKSFFSEIISSISDARFSRDGRYILSRDYLTLKIWDVRNESKPVTVLPVHDHLSGKLCELYESDAIFDRFECCWAGDSGNVATGSYGSLFHVYDRDGKTDNVLEASRNVQRKSSSKKGLSRLGRKRDKRADHDINPDTIDFSSKVLHLAFHPHENTMAVANANNLYVIHSS
ncbi:protein phosphatase 2 (formerly 2A), regulatory subunit B [Thecamonas trahens ATCC 50062]|uniref:Serine/threonine-protein phosphatase 2A 55 kDa regulatory subunit B n=1 Tax=Thecamonas trahens ATCC 50062 TaxID=461836 RepID=A0A0L0DHK8_THETB|nr:protein phosphatase 2 (formerly 2A), regulatory subunit B [Thecamonas trahens ATCC 50062]KNC51705.1 protein phosphatase 2 (formerly 2A), regulatory subunit B [Thecamonas trahens ATCC 50062]|eukprot:XP_013755834.1 protein phosphatase 2 (formerly 2A), regulatory subunit B [Thecamonas trahens ATCC 50062]